MARTFGSKNKVSGTAKENIVAVFTRLGSTAAMADWARENLTEFYRIYARLLPTEVQVDSETRIYVMQLPAPQPTADEWQRQQIESSLPLQ